jgi:hypothetical protein
MVSTNNVYLDKKFIDGRIKKFKETFPFHIDKPGSLVGFIADDIIEDSSDLLNTGRNIISCEISKSDGLLRAFHLWAPCLNDDLYSKVLAIQNHGHYTEWIKDYPALYRINIMLAHFTSFHNFKVAANLTHFNGDEVLMYFKLKESVRLFFDIINESDNKHETFKRINKHMNNGDKDLLKDYISMCYKVSRIPRIPSGTNKLIALHDELVDIINMESLANVPKDVVVELESIVEGQEKPHFLEEWERRGLEYVHLNSMYLVKKQGVYQKHCIGNYASKKTMRANSFFSFKWENRMYDIQIINDGNVKQFRGYRNCEPPKELRDLVLGGEMVFNHKINYLQQEPIE